jgi:formylglycine-generating enzyme required for sulfatase activity
VAPPLRFATDEDRWWHGQLDKLVHGLRALAEPEQGLLSEGKSAEHGWSVPRRLAFATTVAERSLTGPGAKQAWSQAIASIADERECPAYRGLLLEPQIGLLPLGRDPRSGLWEFAHLQSGEPPRRGADGALELTEETGLVFVLLPGGSFWMGAQASDPNGRNYYAESPVEEGPVHEVILTPFFCSKYEMTQGQWLRVTGSNPSNVTRSYWRADIVRGRQAWSALHPVEQVNWAASARVARQLGLELPSEAQWEYAARGGTDTPWWCGTDKRCIATSGNVADLYARDHGGSSWGDFEHWDDGSAAHAPIGYTPANPFGLHEVIGNLWEWCLDTFELDFYSRSPLHDPVANSADSSANRVWRGGGFNERCGEARSGHRSGVSPDMAAYVLGLRPVRALARGPADGGR